MTGEILEVAGGPNGLAACWIGVLRLATELDAAGDRLRERAATTAAVAGDPSLLASGLVSPTTAAVAEGAVLAAAASLAATVAEWEVAAIAVRTAIAALQQADESSHDTVRGLDVALTSSPLGPMWLTAALATRQPGLLEHAVAGFSGFGAAGPASLARLYGGPRPTRVAPYAGTVGHERPRSVRDLVEHLHEVAALSPDPASVGNGTIEVQTLRRPDGSVRHVVYLPGTDRFEPPGQAGDDVRELGTDLDLMSGRPDSYTAGVSEAMQAAGIRPGEPVLVVGHSQGGMVAAALAGSGAVTAAVTAGAPTAQVPAYPAGTHVLSLEQRGDVVPLLDGARNPDSVEQTTITFDANPADGVLAHHGYGTYAEGAALVDTSEDPSVTATVAALEADGFVGDDRASVTSQLFQITCAP